MVNTSSKRRQRLAMMDILVVMVIVVTSIILDAVGVSLDIVWPLGCAVVALTVFHLTMRPKPAHRNRP